ncbi:hypothetical protein F5Y13DRAFT_65940 [Hypoxylon sp. FL1857]|nr:hypothetical protein F5Y13DRAFT_65940 [Hypoxylon sp. FL1857]
MPGLTLRNSSILSSSNDLWHTRGPRWKHPRPWVSSYPSRLRPGASTKTSRRSPYLVSFGQCPRHGLCYTRTVLVIKSPTVHAAFAAEATALPATLSNSLSHATVVSHGSPPDLAIYGYTLGFELVSS